MTNLQGKAWRVALAAGTILGAHRASAQFSPSDFYIVTTGAPDATHPCGTSEILRVNTATWVATTIAKPAALNGRACYSRARDRIVACTSQGTPPILVDSTGTQTPLTGSGTNLFTLAAAGPGSIIYMYGTAGVSYYDASNVLHALKDTDGATPYVFPTTGAIGSTGAFTYDPATNCLFFASTIAGDLTEVAKVPLNAAGTQVIGAPTRLSFDASPGSNSEVPVGFSRGPNGKLFLKDDDNSTQLAGRMRFIDPVSMTSLQFAASGYAGVGAETAGAYLPLLGMAVAFDTFGDQFRFFKLGDSGEGSSTIKPTGDAVSNNCGSGESCQVVVIDTCYANCDGSTGSPALSAADFVCYLGKFRANSAYANCDGSTSSPTLTAADFVCFLASFRAGCS
jgi:hypothetical protein